jgi:hypothetical protein
MLSINDATLELAIQRASIAAQKTESFRSETFTAVLIAELLSKPPDPAEVTAIVRYEGPTGSAPRKSYSSAELFASKNWETEIDKVVLAGYFLERYNNLSSFTVQALRDCLLASKVPLPSNINLAIVRAVQKGWVMEIPGKSGARKAWSLTQSSDARVAAMNKSNLT